MIKLFLGSWYVSQHITGIDPYVSWPPESPSVATNAEIFVEKKSSIYRCGADVHTGAEPAEVCFMKSGYDIDS
jgi:hypothetical protein